MFLAIDLLGYAAAILTTLAFVPQVVKTWRSKSARDLSGLTLGAFSLGVFLWLVYGIALGAAPIIAANATTFLLSVVLIGLKIRHS